MEADRDIPADKRTANFIKTVANTISFMIIMEEECPSNHPSGKMPILDLEVWIKEGRIMHQFYKKPMASRKLVSADSAFSTSKKRSILMEEGMRRLRNCSPELSWEAKAAFLNKFSSDMRFSGHTPSFRKTLLRRIVARYETELLNHLTKKKKLYRTRLERIQMNEKTKFAAQKDTWFRVGGSTSTITVPVTPNGLLAEKIRENLKKSRQPTGTKTLVVEDGGVGAKRGLIKSNQFPRDKCEHLDCLLCFQREDQGGGTKCDMSNVGYEGLWERCPEVYAYMGETSRTAYTRFSEHLRNYRGAAAARLPPVPPDGAGLRGRARSWMWEHTRDHHDGEVGDKGGMEDYKVRVTKKFKRCLERQVDEDIRMQHCELSGGTVLSRNEFYTPKSVQPVFRQL